MPGELPFSHLYTESLVCLPTVFLLSHYGCVVRCGGVLAYRREGRSAGTNFGEKGWGGR